MIPTGSNAKQVEIARLRAISLNDQESPVARIQAARKLLQDHGPSQRSLPIIRKVIKLFVSDSDPDIAERAMKLRARLAKILELKSMKLPKEIEDEPVEISADSLNCDAIATEPEVRQSFDVWHRPAPPDTKEVLRIAYIVRDYTTLDRGIEVWRNGLDINTVLDLVLDGRERNTKNLLSLYRFMELPYSSGIRCLAGSVLHRTVSQILRDRSALPPNDPNDKSYSERLFEELQARS